MNMSPLFEQLCNPNGMKVAVLGAGISGKSAAKLLHQLGAVVTVFDSNPSVASEEWLFELFSETTDFSKFAFVVLSPGIARSELPIAQAIQQGVLFVNELDLAYAQLTNCKIIGVTGTNGKSTTTAMIGEILKKRDPEAFVCGNFGRPLCDVLSSGQSPFLGVVELSSFQLETLSVLRLDVAVVTHLSPDHLDRYRSCEDYYNAKNNIFKLLKDDGISVVNQKDANSMAFLKPSKRVVEFNHPLPFSLEHVVGTHNIENASAALSATRALGIDLETIQNALIPFKGIPHRLEFVGENKGVRWFNDSKATNVESSIVAVKSFEKGVHLILGGRGKGASYAPLIDACRHRVKKVYAIGEEAGPIAHAFKDHFAVVASGDLENALRLAVSEVEPGEVILLAPACASYDQYPNFQARGEHFREFYRKECASR